METERVWNRNIALKYIYKSVFSQWVILRNYIISLFDSFMLILVVDVIIVEILVYATVALYFDRVLTERVQNLKVYFKI